MQYKYTLFPRTGCPALGNLLWICIGVLLSACVFVGDAQSHLVRRLPFPAERIFLLADTGVLYKADSIDAMLEELQNRLHAREIETETYRVTGLEVDRTEPIRIIREYKPDYILLLSAKPSEPPAAHYGGHLMAELIDKNQRVYWKFRIHGVRTAKAASKSLLAKRLAKNIIEAMVGDNVLSDRPEDYNKYNDQII